MKYRSLWGSTSLPPFPRLHWICAFDAHTLSGYAQHTDATLPVTWTKPKVLGDCVERRRTRQKQMDCLSLEKVRKNTEREYFKRDFLKKKKAYEKRL